MELALDNEDLLKEILLRLPAKSLTRFKCVCKMWWTLISSDYFCHHHTLRRPKLQPSLILQIHNWYDFPQHYFYFNGEEVIIPYSLGVPRHQIVQACNGLLLLESKQRDYPDELRAARYDGRRYYVIYNPTTRQSRNIIPASYEHPRVEEVSLAFDPSKSPYYKIVCIKSTAESDSLPICYTYEIEVYESERHSWRRVRLEAAFSHPRILYGVYWNNGMYWMKVSKDGCCYFDIATNEMKTLSFPQTPVPSIAYYSHLQESDDHLYLFQFIFESDHRNSIAVWELGMGGDGDHNHNHNHTEWLLKHHHAINIDRLEGKPPSMMRLSHRDRDGDGDRTCSLLTCRYRLLNDGNRMRAYNFVDKTFEDLVNFSTQPLFPVEWSFITAFQFGETLALV